MERIHAACTGRLRPTQGHKIQIPIFFPNQDNCHFIMIADQVTLHSVCDFLCSVRRVIQTITVKIVYFCLTFLFVCSEQKFYSTSYFFSMQKVYMNIKWFLVWILVNGFQQDEGCGFCPITYTGISLRRDLSVASRHRGNNYSKQKLVQCTNGHLNIVLRQNCEAVL